MAKIIVDPSSAGIVPKYIYSGFDTTTLVSLTLNDWAKITNLTNDLFINVINEGMNITNDEFTTDTEGIYKVDLVISTQSGSSNDMHEYRIVKNPGAVQIGFIVRNDIMAGNKAQAISLVGLTSITPSESIEIQVRNVNDNDDISVDTGQFVICRVS